MIILRCEVRTADWMRQYCPSKICGWLLWCAHLSTAWCCHGGETREIFLWDKIDQVKHSDLLMFHYSIQICVFDVVRCHCAVSATTPCFCREVLPLVPIRLAHRLTVLTSTRLPMHFGQTFTNAEQLLSFSHSSATQITLRLPWPLFGYPFTLRRP
jgi:hypothetical protein